MQDRVDHGFDVDIQPDVSALRMFRSMSFTPWYALGEFVDNSITSAIKSRNELIAANGPDYQLRVKIDFPAGEDRLIIEDNAAGISRNEIQRALRMGKAPQDMSIGLSRHGVGMKAAAFWWGGTLEILTYPLGEPNGWRTVIDVSQEGDVAKSAHVEMIPMRPSGSGTVVRISGLWQKTPKGRTKGAIRSYLPSIYRAFLGGGTGHAEVPCELFYEGHQLTYENPSLLEAPFWATKDGPQEGSEPILWKGSFETTLSTGKKVSGWFGILETMSRDMSGFFLHYRGKGIAGVVPIIDESGNGGHEAQGAKDAIARASYKPRKIFGPAGLYRDQSFVGEFDVSDFGKTISTDAPLWSPEEESEFVANLFDFMTSDESMNFIKMGNNFRRRKAVKEEQKAITEAAQLEAKRIEEALSDSVEHHEVAVTDLAKDYAEPPSLQGDSADEDEAGTEHKFIIRDRDGHRHEFVLHFISDRSADFIGVYGTKDGLQHTVRVNQSHTILDDVPSNAYVHTLLARIAVGLASAEVFLTMAHKQQVRESMNEYLAMIGAQSLNA